MPNMNILRETHDTVDDLFIALGDLGYTGTINDRTFWYLRDAGYTGSLNDMLLSYFDISLINPVTTFFGSSEEGGLYLPGDISTLWQDTGRTSAVTAAGQNVAAMDDLSGNDNHLLLTTGIGPTYEVDAGGKGYLAFPQGAGNRLRNAAGVDPLADIFTGAAVRSEVKSAGAYVEFGVTNVSNLAAGSIRIGSSNLLLMKFTAGTTTPDTAWFSYDGATPTNYNCQSYKPAFADGVGTSDAWLRVNGVEEGVTITDTGAQTGDISIGHLTNAVPLRFYGGFVRVAGPTADLDAVDTWLASLVGE